MVGAMENKINVIITPDEEGEGEDCVADLLEADLQHINQGDGVQIKTNMIPALNKEIVEYTMFQPEVENFFND